MKTAYSHYTDGAPFRQAFLLLLYFQALSSELSTAGAKVVAIKCDVTKEHGILAMFEQIQSQLGTISVLVNNAGLAHNAPLLTGETSQWREMVEVSFSEVYLPEVDPGF